MQLDFGPYKSYRKLISQIDEFAELSHASFGLAQQLLFKHPKDALPPFLPVKLARNQLSYGMGDQEVAGIDLLCEWIPLDAYAEREQRSVQEVTAAAEQGLLGPVHQGNDGVRQVLWPPAYHTADQSEWPEIGMKKFSVRFTIAAKAPIGPDPSNLDAFEDTQRQYLRLAHALGEPMNVAERATQILNRSLFLLEWIAFEVFLRSTIDELIRRHPHVLAAGRRGKENVTLEEVVSWSKGLSDISLLRDSLTNREIGHREGGGESVHGLLNFLKSQFKFKDDPYQAWYVIGGVRKTTSYNELLEFKETRNALVHDAGYASDNFRSAYPAVPIRDEMIIIKDEFYLRAALALRSISYLVAESISSGSYNA